MSAKFAAAIRRKLRDLGILEPTICNTIVPPHTIALVRSHSSGLILQVRHGAKDLRIWFCAPAANTVASVGVTMEIDILKSRPVNYENQSEPFHTVVPPTIGITLQPLWDKLGITCRKATFADVFAYPDELVTVTGLCKLRNNCTSVGAYLLVTHAMVYRAHGVGWLNQYAEQLIDPHIHGVCCEYSSVSIPADLATLFLPDVISALKTGKTALLMMTGSLDRLLTNVGKWNAVPV